MRQVSIRFKCLDHVYHPGIPKRAIGRTATNKAVGWYLVSFGKLPLRSVYG